MKQGDKTVKRTEIYSIFSSAPADGSMITVAGWVRTSRESKNVGFLEINDGSCFGNLQIIIDAQAFDNFKELANLPVGSAVIVNGKVVLTPGAKQPLEIHAAEVTIEGTCDSDYPLQKKRHTLEFLRTIPHLRARSNTYSAVFRVRSEAAYALHSFFNSNRFVYVNTPLITGSDCEGAGEMFRVTTLDPANPPMTEDGKVDFSQDFFGQETNLTVSGQLEAEGFALAFGKVYTFGPTFRAEKSNTARHAAEFWMVEPEMAFADLEDDMTTAEAMIKYVVKHLLSTCSAELTFFNNFYDKTLLERLNNLISSEFGRVSYTEAVEILKAHNEEFEYKVDWGTDLQTEHERFLTEKIYQKPVFVYNYPKEIKSFYMYQNDDGKTVAAADMLVPGVGELIGGSQRETRYDLLMNRIKELGLNEEQYRWYLDLRRFGSATHSGFGLGFERLIMYVTGISNIRDVELYPRCTGKLV
ncbi:MAG: asparagine--tRNA ligase [Parasporobacterium sp.]|nr:asparagine--tRNA ligase [Parasporobacterium sp.]